MNASPHASAENDESTAREPSRLPSGSETGDGADPSVFSDVEGARLFALVRGRMFATAADQAELRVGRYRLQRRLGAGAMGEVHLGHDETLDRPVAIKFVHGHLGGERWARRLRLEARALARLAHANVVHVYEVGEFAGHVFLAMEYVEGQSLREWVLGERPDWAQIVAAYVAAGRGLAAAHAAGVVHRDFKPDNVLRGEDGRIAVADFGLAAVGVDASAAEAETGDRRRAASFEGVSRTGEVKGTPAYMAPEQFRGEVDARADQFALCVSLYEALWGQRPHAPPTGDALDDRAWQMQAPPSSADRAVPAWIWPILRRGLAVAPEARWPSVDALIEALERGLDRPRRRRLWLRSSVAAVGLAAVSAVAVAWWGPGSTAVVEDCSALAAELDDTWGDDRQRQLAAVFAETAAEPGPSWIGAGEAPVVAGLGRWRERWLAARAAQCEARPGGDPLILARVDACLERQRRSTEAVVADLLTGERQALRAGPEAVAALPDPRRCQLDARVGPSAPASAIAEQVAAARRELALVDADLLLGRADRARERVDRLQAQVAPLDDGPLLAELSFARGRALLAEDPQAGFEALEHAADLGEAGHHDLLVAESWLVMATAAATELPDLERGRRWLRRAEAATGRVGVDDRSAARLDHTRGALHLLAQEFDVAAEDLTRAVAGFVAVEDRLGQSRAIEALAVTRMMQGEREQALALFEQALALREAIHGRRHPAVAAVANNLGQAAFEANQPELARTMLARAIEIWSGAEGLGQREAGRAQFVLGQLELGAGRPAQARAHAQAAADIYGRALAAGEIEHAEVAALLGACDYFLGDHAAAIEHDRQAVDGYARSYGADSVYPAYFRVGLGWPLLATGEIEQARTAFAAGLEVLGAHGAGESEIGVDARFGLVAVALADGDLEQAAARLDALSPVALRPMEAVEYALFSGLLERRRDHGAGEALTRAGVLAKQVPCGRETVANLLRSVGANADERARVEGDG